MAFDLPPKLMVPALIRPAASRVFDKGFLPAHRRERRAALAAIIASGKLRKAEAANALVLKMVPPSLAMLMVTQLIGFGAGSGGLDASTLLLLHCDGADASTTFTDHSHYGRTVTAVGNAQIDTGQSQFGGASGQFDGTGDYLTVPDSADWVFGTNSFTIDFWARLAVATSGGTFAGQWTDGNNGWRFAARTDNGRINFQLFAAGAAVVDMQSTTPLVNATWAHVALVRSASNRWDLYKDGTSIANSTATNSVGNYTGVLQIASGANSTPGAGALSAGHLDEFRIRNVAEWTANFTPPAAPYG